jgi:hypothetical protein
MNWIKGKKKSCKSESPDFLGESEGNPNNRHFIPMDRVSKSRESCHPVETFNRDLSNLCRDRTTERYRQDAHATTR